MTSNDLKMTSNDLKMSLNEQGKKVKTKRVLRRGDPKDDNHTQGRDPFDQVFSCG